MLKRSLTFYVTEILRGPAVYGHKSIIGPHHLTWGELANNHSRILALAARDHGKSHFWCYGYPLWNADRRHPGQLGYIFSATEQQAIEHLDKIRWEIMGGGEHGKRPNRKLAHLLPLRKDSKKTIRFANGSEIRARGFGTRVRGGHPQWIICDDVGNDEWMWSETVRVKHIDYFLSAIENMVVPGGQLIVVGTPFHALDLYNHLEEGGVFEVQKNPALVDGKPLWPARYDLAGLDRKKRTLNSSLRWSREFLCRPISDESSLFPSTLFDQPGVKEPFALGMPHVWRDRGMDVFLGVDLALSASASGDYFVIVAVAVDQWGNRYIVDLIRRKGLGYQQQVDLIVNTSKRYGAGLVFVESNQYQRVISDMVVRTSDCPIMAFYTTGRGGSRQVTAMRRGMSQSYSANKNALDQGIPSLRMLLENCKMKIPWAPDTRETIKILISELQAFGWAEGKMQGVGAHDDCVMALWMADRAANIGASFGFSMDDDAAVPPDADLDVFGSTLEAPSDEDVDFFGGGSPNDWRPREGVGLSW